MNYKKYKLRFLVFLFLLSRINLNAQWVPTAPGTSPVIDFVELNDKLYATGNKGLYVSKDDGKNWSKIYNSNNPPFNNYLYSLTLDGNNLYINYNSHLYKTKNFGTNWQLLIKEYCRYFDVQNNEILAIRESSNNYLMFSNDGGTTWADITKNLPNATNFSYIIKILNNKYYLFNQIDHTLLTSIDKGNSWKNENFNEDIKGIHKSNNKIYLTTEKGIYINDITQSWVKKNIPETPEAISAKGDTLYASIDYGKIYRSYDGGDTWKKLPEDKDLFWANGYKNIFISSKGYLYAPATFGLKISKDKGESWYPSNTENFAAAECWGVDTLKNRIIASFGDYDSGSCLSDDNGFIWANDYPIRTFYDIQVTEKVTFLSQYDGFFISYNNGSTWAKSDIDSSKFYSSILSIDKSVIVITDKGIYISDNEWIIWKKTGNNGVNSFITKIKTNGSRIFGLSSDGNIYSSDDKCENWVMISSNLPNFSNFRNIYCFEDLIVASGSSDLFVSKDNGKTWKSISNGLFYSSYKEIIYYKNKLIVGGTPAYISNESFTEWYPIEDNGQMYVDDNNGFAIMNGELFLATRFTGLFKYKLDELIKVSNKDISSSQKQNSICIFPNPVKDVLNIDIEQPIDATILDLDGKLILHPTCSNQKIDVSGLKSGNYILKIKNKTREFSQQFVKE